MNYIRFAFIAGSMCLFAAWCGEGTSVYNWQKRDSFDDIMDYLTEVTAENCRSKSKDQLQLPAASVAQLPLYNMLLSSVIHSNRSQLLHVHNLALNRAFFYSFIYQRLNRSEDFLDQPGLMYLYMSAAADVTGSQGFINGSGIFFDNHCYYPNWFNQIVDFNQTLPLFGPGAWREDDYQETTNYLREPTNRTVAIHDYGAGIGSNYSSQAYKTAPWYSPWLPDLSGNQDSIRKYTYTVGIKYSNETGKFVFNEFQAMPFFGPPQPRQSDTKDLLPVVWSDPYFDCGRSNKWIVTASAPVVEYMPRYSPFIHLRRPRFTAVSAMAIEFERIDINPCPISDGNQQPNLFAGTARCKSTTTCEVIPGFGFRRGGYKCVCKPGYYYPWWHDGPFLGVEIEQATWEEYEDGFHCLSVEERQVIPNEMPTFVEKKKRSVSQDTVMRDKFIEAIMPATSPRVKYVAKRSTKSDKITRLRQRRFVPFYDGEKKHLRHKRDLFDETVYSRMQKVMDRKQSISSSNCLTKPDFERYLPGDAAYGVEKEFEAQGRTALRLAHFLCDFLQNVDEYESFGTVNGDRRLNETHLFGEVLANVMSDFKVEGSGVFFDKYKFRMSPPANNTDPRFVNGITREYFGPYAFRINTEGDGLDNFKGVDFAGKTDHYTDKRWFRDMKARWQTNFSGLKQYTAKPMIRSDPDGSSLVRWEYYPITYYAPLYEQGEWLRPEFRCDPEEGIMDWIVTYVIPFFGTNSLKDRLEFHGVVTIEAKLDYLPIHQCPQDFDVANAFKNTARCHFKSQYCLPLPSQTPTNRYVPGAYKCECRQGYEYPFNDLAWFYDGQMMEEEYSKMMSGLENRYETLKCRIAGASSVAASWMLITWTSLMIMWWNRK